MEFSFFTKETFLFNWQRSLRNHDHPKCRVSSLVSMNTSIYKTLSHISLREHWKKGQKDYWSQKIREFALRLCLPATSVARSVKFTKQDYPNMSWTRIYQQTCHIGWGMSTKPPPHTKTYRKLNKAGSRRDGTSQERTHQLVVSAKPLALKTSNIIWTQQVIFMNIYTNIYAITIN